MSDILTTYTFLPWLREGIANNITKGSGDGVLLRAAIPIRLTVSGTKLDNSLTPDEFVDKTIDLYGPGDIIGVDAKAIIKSEPRNYITNFEPNYLPFVEFYEEDFPWRYTPAAPNINKLVPWLSLVVLKEDEFGDGQDMKEKPLPYFSLKEGKKTADIFPDINSLWAWAHVHVNDDLSDNATPSNIDSMSNTVTAAITGIIRNTPDQAYSRIICPRKLEANVSYHAFVIPTFETGRMIGLGLKIPADTDANKIAWSDAVNVDFPYYHRWFFRTGNVGDFEYLVNLLQPKPADKKVGVRDIDVLHPGKNIPKITNPDLEGVLKLGGALRVPFDSLKPDDQEEVRLYDEWDNPYPHAFTTGMAKRINLANGYTDPTQNIQQLNTQAGIEMTEGNVTKTDPDPVITSPLYGQWHAMQTRLLLAANNTPLPNNRNWIHELNLDPRFRVASGLGTKVIQKNQEEYMQAAWEQVGQIVEANQKIKEAELAQAVSVKLYERHILSLIPERAFIMTAPVHRRIIYNNITVPAQLAESNLPNATVSGAFRAITRPRGPMMKKMAFTATATPNNLLQRINNGEVVIAPPKVDPQGAINLTDIAANAEPKNIPAGIKDILRQHKWLKYLPFILLLLLLLLMLFFFGSLLSWGVAVVIAGGIVWLYRKIQSWLKAIADADAVAQTSQVPGAVDDYPMIPGFVISTPGSAYNPVPGNSDSDEGIRFKEALKDAFILVSTKFPDKVRKPVNFTAVTKEIVVSIDPVTTIPKRTLNTVNIPKRIHDNMTEVFGKILVYPEIDVPMYKPLADLSSEYFLPNINLIEQNSITLLENNQKFIESYMVGINHEMSRELLWREYPTDQRGTYFRQFWDVSSFLPPQPVPADLKESLRDIPPIHLWSKTNTSPANPGVPQSPLKNELGQHNLRAATSGKTQLVLVIRGELLKKYPTAMVYAHKADWGKNENNVTDVKAERVFAAIPDENNPPVNILKTPLFEAKVDPDIYFFGFDLDDEEARGTLHPTNTSDDPGWFFVIKERPGEPRFGLDIEKAKNAANEEKIINWNNLSWKDVGTADGNCIVLPAQAITFNTYNVNNDQENKPDTDDIQAKWAANNTDAAQLAYILYQVPVLVGVHASRMLPK